MVKVEVRIPRDWKQALVARANRKQLPLAAYIRSELDPYHDERREE